MLLEHGFKPTRSVILAFGFDEEINGLRVCIRFFFGFDIYPESVLIAHDRVPHSWQNIFWKSMAKTVLLCSSTRAVRPYNTRHLRNDMSSLTLKV